MTDEPASPSPDAPSGPPGDAPDSGPSPESTDRGRPVRHAPDPWAHRRAEPRTFAFIWTMYLFLATVSTYAVAMTAGLGGHDVVRPAARMLLALVGAGIAIIWPMVRLSQLPDRRPLAGPVLDTIVVLGPVQAIIWPQVAWWLAGWPLPVVAAVAIALAAWALIIAAVIALTHALRAAGRLPPALWMTIVIAAFAVLHIPALFQPDPGSDDPVRTSWMLSPVLSAFELTRDQTWIGTPAVVFGGHWRMIVLLWGCAAALWLVAALTALRHAGRVGGRGLH